MQKTAVDRIEEEIRGWFAEGIDIDPETLQFIESTWGAVSGPVVAQLFACAGDETEVLLDLLFCPEEALCIRIEGHLAPEGLPADRRELLARRLRSKPLETRIRSADTTASLVLPGDLVHGFLARLHLDRPVDDQVAAAAAERFSSHHVRVRRRLRQARLCRSRVERESLTAFFAARGPDRDDFWPLLDSLIGFLEVYGEADLFTAFSDRKKRCLRHLRQSADRNRTLQRHNIETLLIGGDRMPHVDADALALEILRIDELSRILFGSPAPDASGGRPFDLGEVTDRRDLDRVVQFFLASEKG